MEAAVEPLAAERAAVQRQLRELREKVAELQRRIDELESSVS